MSSQQDTGATPAVSSGSVRQQEIRIITTRLACGPWFLSGRTLVVDDRLTPTERLRALALVIRSE